MRYTYGFLLFYYYFFVIWRGALLSNTILLFFGFCHIVSEPHHWQPQLLAGKGIHRQHKLLEALSLSCCVFFLFCSSYCSLHSPIASLQQLFADQVFHHYCAYSVLHVLFFFPNESAINSELVNSYVYFAGYGTHQKGCRCYYSTSKKLYFSCHVVFLESISYSTVLPKTAPVSKDI